jgi:endonuclease/exonuclease/phosphatase family metal-dependent hydrolase
MNLARTGDRRRHRVALALLGACGLLIAGCTTSGSTASSASDATAAPMTLKVMEFNIEYGGEVVDFSGVPAAIEKVDPDVVAIEEGYGQLPRIAEALGWKYYDPRTQVVSKYPLLATDDPHYNLIEVTPGHVVALANLHLPSAPYSPFYARRGASVDRLIELENRGRVQHAQASLDAVAPLVAAGVPTIVTGDFNAPSYRDWTEQTVGLREQITQPVPWPVSKNVEAAGFVDTYRAIHPDPVSDPGLTWPANRPISGSYNPYRHGDPRDRIDFIYVAHGTPTASVVIGEEGTPGVDVTSSPWPSDHRAVMTTMTVTPGSPPPIVSAQSRRTVVGTPIVASYHGDGSAGAQLVVVAQGADATATPIASADAPQTQPLSTVTIPTTSWQPGAYDLVLVDQAGTELSRGSVWVEASDAATISTDRRVYRPGQPITVTWDGAAGNRWDWVGLYPFHAKTGRGNYQQWFYTDSTVQGSHQLDASTHGGQWPLRPGRYTIYLLVDDSYVNVAGTDIRIVR